MKFPYCGKEHSDSAKFCENTGKPLEGFNENFSECQKLESNLTEFPTSMKSLLS